MLCTLDFLNVTVFWYIYVTCICSAISSLGRKNYILTGTVANVISLFLSMSEVGDLQGSLSISIQRCCLRVSFICSQSPLSAPTFWTCYFPIFISLLVLAAIPCGYITAAEHSSFLLVVAAARCYVSAYRLPAEFPVQIRTEAVALCLRAFVVCCCSQWFHSSPNSDPGSLIIHRNSLVKHIFLGFNCYYLSQEFWSESVGVRIGNLMYPFV